MLEIDFHSLYCTPSIGGFPDCRQHSPPLRGRFSEERYFNIHSIFHSNRAFVKTKKFWVWLYWRGCQPLTTHWCDPTTDSHGDSWLLGFPPGPVRLSLDNLILFSSLKEAMLMQVLVRTLDRHESVADRNPLSQDDHECLEDIRPFQENAPSLSPRQKLPELQCNVPIRAV